MMKVIASLPSSRNECKCINEKTGAGAMLSGPANLDDARTLNASRVLPASCFPCLRECSNQLSTTTLYIHSPSLLRFVLMTLASI